jgi:hypothetical protein
MPTDASPAPRNVRSRTASPAVIARMLVTASSVGAPLRPAVTKASGGTAAARTTAVVRPSRAGLMDAPRPRAPRAAPPRSPGRTSR